EWLVDNPLLYNIFQLRQIRQSARQEEGFQLPLIFEYLLRVSHLIDSNRPDQVDFVDKLDLSLQWNEANLMLQVHFRLQYLFLPNKFSTRHQLDSFLINNYILFLFQLKIEADTEYSLIKTMFPHRHN